MSTTDIEHVRACLGSKYAIERELGRGGMGAVYLARDLRLDRAVALKVLPPEFSAQPALRERFLRETRTSASFSHPNIVPVHAIEETDDILAFAMGYVEGESLTERVRRAGPFGMRELVRLLQDLGYALAYAHGRGVVHRDLKPDNVMIERATGRALLMDFGIARPIDTGVTSSRAGLTRIGEVVGTPEYMSPEQATADKLDGRSDVYSLGLIALFAATGRTAMEADTPRSVIVRQLTELPTSLALLRPDLPASLTSAVDRCVQKDPAVRFQSAESLVEAIDATQLAPREIPLQIRSLVQELSTLLLLLTLVLGMAVFVVRDMPTFMPLYVRLLPASLFLAVGVARIWQSLSEVRRMAEMGYTLDDLMRGLRGVVDEQATVRDEARQVARVVTRRRRAVRTALISLPLGLLALYLAVVVVVPPRQDAASRAKGTQSAPATADSVRRVRNPGPPPNEKPAAALILVSFSLIGFSLVSLSRSPFRMPIAEWVFRQTLLRAPGRAFLAIGVRAADHADVPNGGRMATPPRAVTSTYERTLTSPPAPRTNTETTPATTTVSALERRVAALEQWRDAQSNSKSDAPHDAARDV